FSINGEANYLFPLKGGKITPYALAGLNFITVSVKVEGNAAGVVSGEVAESESGLSFNFGGGVDFNLDKITPFVEIKYSAGEANYAVIVGGIKFLFN
ncbi:MAG: outer membrane beta-barrel protein, partial [Microscillaceae bacterium]|nr:outer membrane beta-barrel protein [Microscillaceae bacterium]